MNLIPIVYNTNSGSRVRVIDVNDSAISPIDLPAYVELSQDGTELTFAFPRSEEPIIVYPVTQTLSVIVGKTSGRFYKIVGMQGSINEFERAQICSSLNSPNRSVRFINNIVGYIDFANNIYSRHL